MILMKAIKRMHFEKKCAFNFCFEKRIDESYSNQ